MPNLSWSFSEEADEEEEEEEEEEECSSTCPLIFLSVSSNPCCDFDTVGNWGRQFLTASLKCAVRSKNNARYKNKMKNKEKHPMVNSINCEIIWNEKSQILMKTCFLTKNRKV